MPMPEIPAQELVPLRLPPRLAGLRRLAFNLYWTWHPEVRELFSRIDAGAWERYRSPVPLLHLDRDWTELLDNEGFMVDYEAVVAGFDAYLANGAGHWYPGGAGATFAGPVAYFCAEYGIHETLGLYSGGLGVLAGDHCKTASDMALPFVAVGLFYRHGYFSQTIDADGHQEHAYPDFDPRRMPLQRVIGPDGDPLMVPVELPGRTVQCAVWRVEVGRVPLLLLDSDVPQNAPEDRPITHILYVRGREMRLYQEIVLGVGGVRALRALGIDPAAWHLNEGHSALLLVERARELMADGMPFDEALAAVRAASVFTIHTPIAAGNERFAADLVRRLTAPLLAGVGLDVERILELGRGPDGNAGEFDMTAFCLRATSRANAVSQLHGRTANATWHEVAGQDILAITNGVHVASWLGTPLRRLYEQRGADLDRLDAARPADRFWEHLGDLEDDRLWAAHRHLKVELALFARRHLRHQFARLGEAPEALGLLSQALDPAILTIGFARRFATYKRAELLFTDEARLAAILCDSDHPVQVVMAGKAHPADRPGQQVIRDIFARSRDERLRGRVLILENYDMRMARRLVRGTDVWLNTPRRPLEASGTSGMKAGANGAINCSVLDGWWDEGYTGDNGWAIGGRDIDPDDRAQDWADAQALYRLLADEIVPLYYDRAEDGLPHGWLDLMRRSLASITWRFSATRMLEEYVAQLYLPAASGAMRRRQVSTGR
ncbi:MAG TPA: alpha-glucan family phosphorylase [Candidatus Sulfotelmatobacter sp.]|nr:alpha-glucan family phosphorylase [Candidatus Sulfotelmatobacter sp.]